MKCRVIVTENYDLRNFLEIWFISSLVAPSLFLINVVLIGRALHFQAVCTFYLHPLGCSLRLAHIRTALSTFCTVCFVVTLITGVLARLAYKGWFVAFPLSFHPSRPPTRVVFNSSRILMFVSFRFAGTNPRKWYREDGGWELHVASTITEWLCAGAFAVYILTFSEEFRDVKVIHPKVYDRQRWSERVIR